MDKDRRYHYATVACTGTVSYRTEILLAGHWSQCDTTTYQSAEYFDWNELPPDMPVLDMRAIPLDDVFALLRHDPNEPDVFAPVEVRSLYKLARYHAAGIPRRFAWEYAVGAYADTADTL